MRHQLVLHCSYWLKLNANPFLYLNRSPLLFKTLISVWYEEPFYFKLYCNVVAKIMPNHTTFNFYNVILMRHESNHFAAMNIMSYFNQSIFCLNSINLWSKCLPPDLRLVSYSCVVNFWRACLKKMNYRRICSRSLFLSLSLFKAWTAKQRQQMFYLWIYIQYSVVLRNNVQLKEHV